MKNSAATDKTIVSLQKDLVLKNVTEIKGVLSEATSKNMDIELKSEEELNADMAGIQLLLALSKSASASGRKVQLQIPFPKEVWAVIEKAGLHQLLMAIEK